MSEKIVQYGASLRLERLTKHFGPVIAVDRIDLDVQPGEFITLLGPSGSGKTTTLSMIGGFEEPTDGEIYVNDRPISGLPPYKRHLGMVFQNYALFPHMTVFDNIAFPLKLRHMSDGEIERRVHRMLDIVRLPGYDDRYPGQLSGGQQQRIALARALVFDPQVLLMDEPLGALDKKLREEMQLEIRRLHAELEVTIVYVTHDQEEALTMSDRIAIMNGGRIEQIGDPEGVYERPATAFVANFIGESNFFEGYVDVVTGGEVALRTNDDLTLRAHNSCGMSNGDPVTLVVRPERLMLTNGDEGLPNVVEGIVEEIIYVGHSLRYLVRIGTERIVTVQKPGSAGSRLRQHDRVHVGWRLEDGIMLPNNE